jgi:uncharacterized membrane protein YkoI
MKKHTILSVITLLTLTLITACADNNNDTEIPVSDVPANVITIVQNILPGIILSEAEKELEGETVIYELEGKLINGKKYEIEITEFGEIIKIELEN